MGGYFHCEKVFQDTEGHYVMVLGRIAGFKLTLLNAYGPNEDYPQFFKKLAHLVADHGEGFFFNGWRFKLRTE